MLLHGLLAMAARGSGITGANQTQPRRWMILCLIRVFAVENRSLKLQPEIQVINSAGDSLPHGNPNDAAEITSPARRPVLRVPSSPCR